jgi:inorganic pyrophosphatase
MSENRDFQKLLDLNGIYNVDKPRARNIRETHAAFEGYPQKHPTDRNLLILMTAPFSVDSKFYEFSIDTIGKVEDLGKITNENGESVNRARIWIKKGMPAIISESFIVE